MIKECHWLYLQDEMSRIGSGFRLVELSYGRKWVHVRDKGGTSSRYRLSKRKWNDIHSRMVKYWERNNSNSRFNTFLIGDKDDAKE